MIYKKKHKRVKIGKDSVIHLTPKDCAILDCLIPYIKSKGEVEKITDIYKKVHRDVSPSIDREKIKYCLMVLCAKRLISLKNWKKPTQKKWRTIIKWKV